jgi:nitrogenase molybdenum-iron protein alpha/beta subunit
MATTLQTLVDEAASYIKAELVTSGTPAVYDEDSNAIVDKLISALNEAKNIIAKQRFPVVFAEDVTLDADSCFDPADLANTFYKLNKVTSGDSAITAELNVGVYECSATAGSTVTVEYQYIPSDMLTLKNLGDSADAEYPFPDRISYRVLCYFAAGRYYEIRGGQSDQRKSQIWMARWNEAIRKINGADKPHRQVKGIYNYDEAVL